MKRCASAFLALVGQICLASGTADAQPVVWPVAGGGNGHAYDWVPGYLPWDQAKLVASQHRYEGSQGHLATFTSQAESDFVLSNFGSLIGWIGGFQDRTAPDFAEPAGGWRWITGEPFAYTNWWTANGFPDEFQNKQQDFLRTERNFLQWDDIQNDSGGGINGYFIEYPDPMPTTGPPLPVVRDISTGYDNDGGALIADQAMDDDYTLTSSTLYTTEARSEANLPGTFIGDDAMPGSKWILLEGAAGSNQIPAGDYVFAIDVDLTGFDAAQAVIDDLVISVDNAIVEIAINGDPVFSQVPSANAGEFTFFRTIGDVGLGMFDPGLNELTFTTRNTTLGSSPAGLRVSGIVRAPALIPEPGVTAPTLFMAWWLLGRRRGQAWRP